MYKSLHFSLKLSHFTKSLNHYWRGTTRGRKTDRILQDVLNDSDVSDFEGECGNDASNMFKLSMDSDRTVLF